jgi:hypothetical protein
MFVLQWLDLAMPTLACHSLLIKITIWRTSIIVDVLLGIVVAVLA